MMVPKHMPKHVVDSIIANILVGQCSECVSIFFDRYMFIVDNQSGEVPLMACSLLGDGQRDSVCFAQWKVCLDPYGGVG